MYQPNDAPINWKCLSYHFIYLYTLVFVFEFVPKSGSTYIHTYIHTYMSHSFIIMKATKSKGKKMRNKFRRDLKDKHMERNRNEKEIYE